MRFCQYLNRLGLHTDPQYELSEPTEKELGKLFAEAGLGESKVVAITLVSAVLISGYKKKPYLNLKNRQDLKRAAKKLANGLAVFDDPEFGQAFLIHWNFITAIGSKTDFVAGDIEDTREFITTTISILKFTAKTMEEGKLLLSNPDGGRKDYDEINFFFLSLMMFESVTGLKASRPTTGLFYRFMDILMKEYDEDYARDHEHLIAEAIEISKEYRSG